MNRIGPTTYLILLSSILLWCGWALIIYLSNFGWLPWNDEVTRGFEEVGQFGDAFGAFSSLMAALAAGAALSAFLTQRKEIRSQEFERNFYILLQNMQTHIQQTDLSQADEGGAQKLRQKIDCKPDAILIYHVERAFLPSRATVTGRDAFKALTNMLRLNIRDEKKFRDSKSIHTIYAGFYNHWNDDLGHYFRTLYHLFKMINDECPSDPMRYARIARSHLSSSEIVLLAYNCSVGEGRHKFKKFVNKFALLHNYYKNEPNSFYKEELRFFQRMFEPSAFGDFTDEPFDYSS